MKKIILSGLAATLLLTGCTQRVTDFTIISTKNVDLASIGDFKRGNARITGEDSLFFLVMIPLGTKIDLKEAIDNGIENVPGAVALVDGVVYYRGWHIGLFGEQAYVVEGTPLIDPKLASAEGLPSNYIVSQWDEIKETMVNKYVSKEEYLSLKKTSTEDLSFKSL